MADMRIEIGFAGGGSTVTTVDEVELQKLESALTSGDGPWLRMPAKDDEELLIHTAQVVFVRVNHVLRQVGFAGIG